MRSKQPRITFDDILFIHVQYQTISPEDFQSKKRKTVQEAELKIYMHEGTNRKC